MPRLPAALGWLLAAVALAGVAWALLVPPWQVPDEDAHFAYAQTLAELGRTPAGDAPAQSSEQRLAARASGFEASHLRVEADPEWSSAAEERWRARQAALPAAAREDGGGENPAGYNTPVYYAYAAVPYLAARSGSVLDRLYLMRLASVPLLLAFATTAWLLAGEALGRDRPAQLAAAAVAGLAPMVTFVGSGVTPDALLLPLSGLVLWLAVRGLRRGVSARSALLLVAATAAAVVVKPQALALVPGVLLVLAGRRRVPGAALLAAAAAGAIALGLVSALLEDSSPARAAGYLWQFYLPELPGQARWAALDPWPLRDVWLEQVVGAFGWLEVRLPGPLYWLVGVAGTLVAGAGVWAARAHRRGLAFAALVAASLVAGLHLFEYRTLLAGEGAFIQGRYLLPLAPLAGVAVAFALRTVPAVWRPAALGVLLGALAALQLASLAAVAGRFYA